MTEVYMQILLDMEVLCPWKTRDVHKKFQENRWMQGNSTQILKFLNESFPKTVLGNIRYACSVLIPFCSYLLLPNPVRTRFLILFPNAPQSVNTCMQNKPNNCTTVTSLRDSLLSLAVSIWTNCLIMDGYFLLCGLFCLTLDRSQTTCPLLSVNWNKTRMLL